MLARRLIACAALCQALAACAVATPLSEGIDSQPTSSIPAPAARSTALPASLDDEDRRRALGALAIALDPQGNGASVRWDNPISKAHGQVTPIGFAYPSKDLICRKFSARFETRTGARGEEGSACRDKDADWTIVDLRPAKPQAAAESAAKTASKTAPLREASITPR
ncbi:MAG TPA: RT0821/Lpp0805 family surface protein [Rhodoblastus sp.]|nr:RT0821/Lpp0805 family surface protein [Rhodoblastus sp.]